MRCAQCEQPAWFCCPQSGVLVCSRHARVEVVAEREERVRKSFVVRPCEPEDLERLEELALHFWGETEVEGFDGVYDVLKLPALVAVVGTELAGFLSCAIEGGRMNLVMFNVAPQFQGHGLGQALLAAAVEEAQRLGLARVVVATSNDDLPALHFYQRAGFTIQKVLPGRILEHHGGLEEGFAGIPVRDEIRLHLSLA